MIELGLLSVTNGFRMVDLVGVDPRCLGVGDEIKGNFDKKKNIFIFFVRLPRPMSPFGHEDVYQDLRVMKIQIHIYVGNYVY